MGRIVLALLLTASSWAFSAEVGILEKAVNAGMEMIEKGKIADAMNEIRVGINCFPYDRVAPSDDCMKSLGGKMSQESDSKKKAAFLVYGAVIFLSDPKDAVGIGKAIELLNEAEKADSALPEVYNTRGVCLLLQKHADKALADFDKAISLNQNYVDAVDNRAYAHLLLGDKDKALQDKERYYRLLGKLYYLDKK